MGKVGEQEEMEKKMKKGRRKRGGAETDGGRG
jgi:hypothetical protein